MAMELESLGRSIDLGSTRIKNRLGFAPMNPGLSSIGAGRSGTVRAFYEGFARGEVGVAYIGGVAVSARGRSNRSSLIMSMETTRRVVEDAVELQSGYGMAVAVQLMHAGRQTSSVEIGQRQLAPSAAPCPYYGEMPAAATREDVRQVVNDFTEASAMAIASGAPIIEIHAAHGYLLSGFMSRITNCRTDSYGGSTRNRFRLLEEIVHSIRSRVRVTLGVRCNVYEVGELGIGVDELIEGLSQFSQQLDFISVSAGMYSIAEDLIIPRRSMGEALWRRESAQVRAALGLPTMIAGNIGTAELADEIIRSEDADIVLMGRSLLADPYLLSKVRADDGNVQACTELYLCKYHSRGASHIYCPHNPSLHEKSMLPKVDRQFARRSSRASESE